MNLLFSEQAGDPSLHWNEGVTLSPVARFGWNHAGTQVIVGLAAPIVWSDGSALLSGFGYLSYELPFNPQPRSARSPPPAQTHPTRPTHRRSRRLQASDG